MKIHKLLHNSEEKNFNLHLKTQTKFQSNLWERQRFSKKKKRNKKNYLPGSLCFLPPHRKLLENTDQQNWGNTRKRKTRVQEAGYPIIITKEAKINSQNHGKRKSLEDRSIDWQKIMKDYKRSILQEKEGIYGTQFNVWPYFEEQYDSMQSQ